MLLPSNGLIIFGHLPDPSKHQEPSHGASDTNAVLLTNAQMEAYNEAEIGAFVGPNLFRGAYNAQASTCFRMSIGEVLSLQIFRHDPSDL